MVRAVALRRVRGVPTVIATASVPRMDEIGNPKLLTAVLAEIDARLRLQGPVIAHVSDLPFMVRIIGTMPLPPDRLARLLRLELIQHADEAGDLAADARPVPVDGDELYHWCVLAPPAAAKEALVGLEKLGLRDASLAYGPAALFNVAQRLPPMEGDALAVVLDIGHERTGISLYGDGRLIASREILMGGLTFQQALKNPAPPPSSGRGTRGSGLRKAEDLDLLEDEPPASQAVFASSEIPAAVPAGEPLVLDLDDGIPMPAAQGVPKEPSDGQELMILAEEASDEAIPSSSPAVSSDSLAPHTAILSNGSGLLASSALDMAQADPVTKPGRDTMAMGRQTLGPELSRAAEALYGQVSNCLHWFRSQLKAPSLIPSKVVLCGGGANVIGLDAYLARRFGVPVERLDVGAAVGGILPEPAGEWAVATGLALSHPSMRVTGAVRLDLRPESLVARRLWRSHLVWAHLAAVALVLAAVMVSWTLAARHDATAAQAADYESYLRRYEALTTELKGLETENEALREDLRGIVGRMYAGRDLLYTVRALKEQAKLSPELWVTELETEGIAQDGTTPAPTVTTGGGGGRLGALGGARPAARAALPAWTDTAIDRGWIEVSGKVRFTSARSVPELQVFFKRWWNDLKGWKHPDWQTPLYIADDGKVMFYEVNPKTEETTRRGVKVREGEFPWRVKIPFQPTRLDQVLMQLPEGAP